MANTREETESPLPAQEKTHPEPVNTPTTDTTPQSLHTTPPQEPLKETPSPAEHKSQFQTIREQFFRTHRTRKIIIAVAAIICIGVVGFGAYAYTYAKSTILDKENAGGIFAQVDNILGEADPLNGESEDRINIALLGIGGEGHSGGQLTDTMLLASVQPSTGDVTMVSIPRDLVVEFPAEDGGYSQYRKINAAYATHDIDFALDKMTEVTGADIHYYGLIDFNGFRDAIDNLGGVDVYVDSPFSDYKYPDYNYGYQTISFEEGWQHFDGERALQYARSRYGNNGSGSDFQRSKRQQQIILAVQKEALKTSTLINPLTLTNLLQSFGEHVRTNMEPWEAVALTNMVGDLSSDSITSNVIDNGPNGLLHSEISSETGAYILIPNAGLTDFSDVHNFVTGIFAAPAETGDATIAGTNDDTESSTPVAVASEVSITDVSNEKAIVVMQNGTLITGLATKTAEDIGFKGVETAYFGNAVVRNQGKTVIYDLSGGNAELTRKALEDHLGVSVITATYPVADSAVRLANDLDPNLIDLSTIPQDTQFVILLGADAPQNSNTL